MPMSHIIQSIKKAVLLKTAFLLWLRCNVRPFLYLSPSARCGSGMKHYIHNIIYTPRASGDIPAAGRKHQTYHSCNLSPFAQTAGWAGKPHKNKAVVYRHRQFFRKKSPWSLPSNLGGRPGSEITFGCPSSLRYLSRKYLRAISSQSKTASSCRITRYF